jgi:hypothetical protein
VRHAGAGNHTFSPDNHQPKGARWKRLTSNRARIIASAGAYKTIFALACCTGLRAGDLLGLTTGDLDFERKLIIPRKQADNSNPAVAGVEDEKSKSPVAMTRDVETMLGNYLRNVWQENPRGLLFPNSVRFGLKHCCESSPLAVACGFPGCGDSNAAQDLGIPAARRGEAHRSMCQNRPGLHEDRGLCSVRSVN